MTTETLTNAGEQMKAGLSEIAGTVKNLSTSFTDHWRDMRADAGRSAKKIKIATEERIAETRQRIKARPFSSLAIVASGAFLLGGLVAWIAAKKR